MINGNVLVTLLQRGAIDEVHTALHHHDILSVRFSWIKYISDWTLSLSGTGYFAAISITCNGNWSPNVMRSASTR